MSELRGVYLRCRVGREWYAISVDNVLRVLHMVALTELPNVGPDVLGLLALPNRVAPVIDLRRRFGVTEAPLRLETPIVVLESEHGTVGVVVDEADDIEPIAASEIEPFVDGMSPYIIGIARHDERLLLVLDASRLSADVRAAGRNGYEHAAAHT